MSRSPWAVHPQVRFSSIPGCVIRVEAVSAVFNDRNLVSQGKLNARSAKSRFLATLGWQVVENLASLSGYLTVLVLEG